jgi:FkbM family methyltransferase
MIEQPGFQTRIANIIAAMRLFRNWPGFIVHYLRRPREPFSVKFRNGLILFMRPGTSDFRIVREIMTWREYERPGFEMQSDFTVVDIGAQIGVFTCYAARLAGHGRVLSFEPHPDNFRLLDQNRSVNHFEHVTVLNRAVAATPGRHQFFASAVNTGGHSLYQQAESGVSFEVEAVRLSDVLSDQGISHINYLKIDCEGAEREILPSLPERVLSQIDRIVMEVHQPVDTTASGLAGWLEQRGFSIVIDGAMVYARRVAPEVNA